MRYQLHLDLRLHRRPVAAGGARLREIQPALSEQQLAVSISCGLVPERSSPALEITLT